MNPHFNRTDPDVLAILTDRISPGRLGTYTALAGGDATEALRLYDWNVTVSAAFSADLARFEVVLRNALDAEASARFGSDWLLRGTGLTADSQRDVHKAQRRLLKRGVDRAALKAAPGRLLAELTLGFWRYLLTADYEQSLWRPALHKAFPHSGRVRRSKVHKPIMHLHELRNRIAHCEPIVRRTLQRDHDDLLMVAGWICPHAQAWIRETSMVPQVLTDRP